MSERFRENDWASIPSGSDNEDRPQPSTQPSNKQFPRLIPGVSLESDSLPETSHVRTIRRKKRMARRPKPSTMDVDPTPGSSKTGGRQGEMDVDGAESHISSSDSERGDNRGGDADDEQSDWVGYSTTDSELFDPSDRRTRRLNPKVQMTQLQKRLERFALEGSKGEMGIEFNVKDRPNSAKFNRMLLQYRLEVVKRQRGNVILRKKLSNCAAVAEYE